MAYHNVMFLKRKSVSRYFMRTFSVKKVKKVGLKIGGFSFYSVEILVK